MMMARQRVNIYQNYWMKINAQYVHKAYQKGAAMKLKIAMLESMILMSKKEAVHQIDHSPSERKLIFRTVSYEIAISGERYDELKEAETMYGVLDVYESIAFQ